MQPSRILPDLQCSLICEDVRQEANGNFFMIGILNYIRVPQLPVTAFRLVFFNRWTAGHGQFIESVRLIAPDQTSLLRKSEIKFALPDVSVHTTNVTVFPQVEFKVAGVYYVEVLVDDVMKLRYPLALTVVPPQQQPPQPPGEPKPSEPGPAS